MNLAIATKVPTPHEAFTAASASYTKALDAITFAPNERVDVRAAVSTAISQVAEAVAHLTPFASHTGDMFTGRNASASIAAATTGATALNNVLMTLDAPGASKPQIPLATFLTMAQNSLKTADAVLWQE